MDATCKRLVFVAEEGNAPVNHVSNQPPGSDEVLQNQSAETDYRPVAFRSHGDGCSHCRATGQVYDQLVTILSDEALAFEEFDLSRSENRPLMEQRISELQLTPLIEGRMETAFLALVNSDGTRMKEFKPSMNAEKIALSVRELISR